MIVLKWLGIAIVSWCLLVIVTKTVSMVFWDELFNRFEEVTVRDERDTEG